MFHRPLRLGMGLTLQNVSRLVNRTLSQTQNLRLKLTTSTSSAINTLPSTAAIDVMSFRRGKRPLKPVRTEHLAGNMNEWMQKLDYDFRRTGRVSYNDVFQVLAQIRSHPSSINSHQSLLLLRCCGSVLCEEPESSRRQMVQELWSILTSTPIQLDISHYNALLKCHLENGKNFDPMNFLQMLEQKDIEPNRVTYQRLIHRYCAIGDIEGATNILEFMKKKDIPVSESVFNSLIIGHSTAGDMKSAIEILDLMKKTGIEPSNDTYTILLGCFPGKLSDQEAEDQFNKLTSSNSIFLSDRNRLEIIKRMSLKCKEPNPVVDKFVDNMIGALEKAVGFNHDCHNTIIDLVNGGKLQVAIKLFYLMPVSQALKENKNSGSFLIQQMVRTKVDPEQVFALCNDLKEKGLHETPFLKAMRSAIIFNDHVLAKVYISRYTKETGQMVEMGDYMKANLMEHEANNGNIKNALNYKDAISGGYILDDIKIISLVTSMVSNGQVREALDILAAESKNEQRLQHHLKRKEMNKDRDDEGNRSDYLNVNRMDRVIFKLLNTVSEKTMDPAIVTQFFDRIIAMTGHQVTNVILGPRIKTFVLKDDLKGALDEFQNCVHTYRLTPWKTELMKMLILKDDTTNLQLITDVSISIHGEPNTLIDLSFSFLKAGRVNQAEKVLSSAGLRAPARKLEIMTNRLISDHNISLLEQFVRISRNLYDVNRDDMYYSLIKCCREANDPNAALNAWTSMQEEGVTPSERTLKYLGHFLKLSGKTVPFQIPSGQVEPDVVRLPGHRASGSMMNLIKEMKEGDLDKALAMRNAMIEKKEKMSINNESLLIERLVSMSRVKEALDITEQLIKESMFPLPRVMRSLLGAASKEGLTDRLESLRGSLPEQLVNQSWFTNTVATAYINCGREEYLLKEVMPTMKPFPLSAILGLMQHKPELEKEVISLAESLAKSEDYHLPLNMVWVHLMRSKRFDEAESIFNSSPKFKEQILYSSLIDDIKKNGDLNLADVLIDILKRTNLSSRTIGIAISSKIDVLVEKNNPVEAESLVLHLMANPVERVNSETGEAIKATGIEDINRLALVRLAHKMMEVEGREPKFQIPQREESKSKMESKVESASSPNFQKDLLGETIPLPLTS